MIEIKFRGRTIQLKTEENGVTTIVMAASEQPITFEDALNIQKELGFPEDIYYFRILGKGSNDFLNKFVSRWSC